MGGFLPEDIDPPRVLPENEMSDDVTREEPEGSSGENDASFAADNPE